MAGFTNLPFRQIVREYGGAGLIATEMVSARGFACLEKKIAERKTPPGFARLIGRIIGPWTSKQTHRACLSDREELPDRLWGVSDEPRPLAVQIWDNDPETMARVAARIAHELRVSVIDLNFGCPAPKVTERSKSGSYLLRTPARVGEIVERVVRAAEPTPVTAKIRLGCTRNHITAYEVAHIVEASGAAALTVHGRTAEDWLKGVADWERISSIKPHLKHIPLIGNGDLDTAEKVVHALNTYDVDGVMIARACLGRPWLFAQAAALLRGEPPMPEPTLEEQKACMVRHYDLLVDRFGPEKATVLMRKFACTYAQGRPGARHFRTHVAKVSTPGEFYAVVEEWFPSAMPVSSPRAGDEAAGLPRLCGQGS